MINTRSIQYFILNLKQHHRFDPNNLTYISSSWSSIKLIMNSFWTTTISSLIQSSHHLKLSSLIFWTTRSTISNLIFFWFFRRVSLSLFVPFRLSMWSRCLTNKLCWFSRTIMISFTERAWNSKTDSIFWMLFLVNFLIMMQKKDYVARLNDIKNESVFVIKRNRKKIVFCSWRIMKNFDS